MPRLLACLLALTFLFGASLRAQDKDKKDEKKEEKKEKEEELLGKTRSEWLNLLHKHEDVKFRKASLIALEAIGPRAKGVVDGIATALESDKDVEVRRDAALTLGRMGIDAKSAMNSLAVALRNDKSEAVREAAAHAFGGPMAEIAEPFALALAQTLKDPSDGPRKAAAVTLKNLGDKAKGTMPMLLEVSSDPKADRIPRLYCLQMITRLCGEKRAEPVKIMTTILTDEKSADTAIKEAAAEGLGQLAVVDAVPVLAKLLDEKAVTLRLAGAVSLGKFGPKASTAWPSVKSLFQDADVRLRYQAIRLAGAMSKEHAKETVSELEKAANKSAESLENRLAALQELGELGREAAAAETTVAALARTDARAAIREAAGETLKKIKGM